LTDYTRGESEVWFDCINAPVQIPPGYFFGITAETGGLSDNHDVYKFEVFTFDPIQNIERPRQMIQQIPQQIPQQVPQQVPQYNQQIPQQNQQIPQQVPQQVPQYNQQIPQQNQQIPQQIPQYNQQIPQQIPQQVPQQNQQVPQQNQQIPQQNQHIPPQNQQPSTEQCSSSDFNKLIQKQTELGNSLNSVESAIKGVQNQFNEFNSKLYAISEIKSSIVPINENMRNLQQEIKRLTTENNELKNIVKEISNQIVSIKTNLDQTSASTRDISLKISENRKQLEETLEKNSSWGFWIYFILFQVVFALLVYVYKTMKEDKNKFY